MKKLTTIFSIILASKSNVFACTYDEGYFLEINLIGYSLLLIFILLTGPYSKRIINLKKQNKITGIGLIIRILFILFLIYILYSIYVFISDILFCG